MPGEPLPKHMPTLLLIILSIILPPLAVGLKCGFAKDFLINLILTLIFWIPGVIHSLYLVLKK